MLHNLLWVFLYTWALLGWQKPFPLSDHSLCLQSFFFFFNSAHCREDFTTASMSLLEIISSSNFERASSWTAWVCVYSMDKKCASTSSQVGFICCSYKSTHSSSAVTRNPKWSEKTKQGPIPIQKATFLKGIFLFQEYTRDLFKSNSDFQLFLILNLSQLKTFSQLKSPVHLCFSGKAIWCKCQAWERRI